MSYDYKTQREVVFTESGQIMFLAIRDKAFSLLRKSGAVRLQEVISGFTGDGWDMLACIDRLVEIGDLKEIPTSGATQHRIFVSRET